MELKFEQTMKTVKVVSMEKLTDSSSELELEQQHQVNWFIVMFFEMPSFRVRRYFVLFKDDFSRYRQVYFMKEKSEVSSKLEEMLAEARTSGNTVKELLSDNGLEFDNEKVRKILWQDGVKQRLITPYTPQQNGCAERDNRTLVEASRAMLYAHSNLLN